MKKIVIAATSLAAMLATAGAAEAGVNVDVNFGQPMMLAPAPVMIAPQPVFVQPRPVIVAQPAYYTAYSRDHHRRDYDWQYWHDHRDPHDPHDHH